jgi:hypothetical protein
MQRFHIHLPAGGSVPRSAPGSVDYTARAVVAAAGPSPSPPRIVSNRKVSLRLAKGRWMMAHPGGSVFILRNR